MRLLGIDVGTGGTRALIIDEHGKVLASAIHEHQPFASPHAGWAEQDPADWWHAAQQAIRAVIEKAGISADEIGGIGLAGQMHGAVLLDENDAVLRPALIWCDQRTQPECDWLNKTIGAERIVELTSNPALTNFTLTKLLWVSTHEPETWKKFRRLLLPKDYVRFCMTGEHAIDVAEASGTLLLDVAHRCWSKEMLEATGIDANSLPPVFESQEVVGHITPEAARLTGLKAGTPVVAGAGDQAAGALGMGIVRPGDVSATIGTSGVVFAATDQPFLEPKGRLHTFCHAIPGRWHVMGVTQAAGLSLRWFKDTFGATGAGDPYDLLAAEAANVPAGSEGVLWTPYLMGERAPHLDPEARATLTGLQAHHRRGHIIRAIMEGVAFSLNDTFTLLAELHVPVNAVRLGGGGARSPLWRQIQADIYGQTVEIVEAEEGAAYGGALLAGVGTGVWATVDDACRDVVRIRQKIQPDPAPKALLQKQYSRYRAIYPALANLFHTEI